jgi:parallel beta-helix repeat protein
MSISVKEFGAKGDGTTDDTAAIRKTIEEANKAGGGIVYFPPGRYKTTEKIVVGVPNLTLQGDGPGASAILGTGASNVLEWPSGGSGGGARNLTVETGASNGVGLGASAQVRWENVQVVCNSATNTGMSISPGGAASEIFRCSVAGAKKYGINVQDDDVSVSYCLVTACGDGVVKAEEADQAGIQAAGENVDRVRLLHNRCVGNGQHGISYVARGEQFGEIVGNTCDENGAAAAAHGVAGRGISCFVGSAPKGLTVIGNHAVGNQETGIFVAHSTANDAVCIGNVCKDNNVGNFPGGHGIEFDVTGIVADNICSGNNCGISVNNDHVAVTGNVCFGNSGSQANGIQISGNHCNIADNLCYENGKNGIRFFTAPEVVTGEHHCISGNQCHGNGGLGIEAGSQVSNSLLSQNICYGNTEGDYSVAAGTAVSLNRDTGDDGFGLVRPVEGAEAEGKLQIPLEGMVAETYQVSIGIEEKAVAIAAPSRRYSGRSLTLDIANNSGGTLGAFSFDAAFKKYPFTPPAKGKRVLGTFYWDRVASLWVQVGPWSPEL